MKSIMNTQGDFLLIIDGGYRHILGLQSVVWYTFGYSIWCIICIFLGLLMRKFDMLRASLSPRCCRLVAENAM